VTPPHAHEDRDGSRPFLGGRGTGEGQDGGAFGDHDVPGTLMGVTVLGYYDQLVEIAAVLD